MLLAVIELAAGVIVMLVRIGVGTGPDVGLVIANVVETDEKPWAEKVSEAWTIAVSL